MHTYADTLDADTRESAPDVLHVIAHGVVDTLKLVHNDVRDEGRFLATVLVQEVVDAHCARELYKAESQMGI